MAEPLRPAWAEVDLDALAHNVALMCRVVAPAELCAVVKADAYGHGAEIVGPAALEAGASCLAVALVEEGVRLRAAGVEAPILILSEPTSAGMVAALAAGLTPTLYTEGGVSDAERVAGSLKTKVGVEVKLDTGMHRVGVDPDRLDKIVEAVRAAPHLRLEGLWTHLAVAEETGDPFNLSQLEEFEAGLVRLGTAVKDCRLHVANSAGAIAMKAARYSLVRSGIALYGYLPGAGPGLKEAFDAVSTEPLRPVLSLRARLHLVRELPAGARPSYGRRFVLAHRTRIGVVPLGYADGIPRNFFEGGGEVLVGGRRRRLVGRVTMDQIMVDCGDDPVAPGDEVVLLGCQGEESVGADEWAERCETIPHEILSRIGSRVPRIATRRDPSEIGSFDQR